MALTKDDEQQYRELLRQKAMAMKAVVATQEDDGEERSTMEKLGEFAKNFPTEMARIYAQPFEFLRNTASTVGKKIGEQIPFKIIPEGATREILSTMQEGGEIKLPLQTTPLLGKTKQYETGREFAGEGLEALANIAIATTPIKNPLLNQVKRGAVIGSTFGVAGGLKDVGASSEDVVRRGGIGAVVGATLPVAAHGVKKLVSTVADVLNRFTNKTTGQALKVMRTTDPKIVKEYSALTAPEAYAKRKATFEAQYDLAVGGNKEKITKGAMQTLKATAQDLVDFDADSASIRKFGELFAKAKSWTIQELQTEIRKMGNKLPKNVNNWTADHWMLNNLLKQSRNVIGDQVPQYKSLNALYGAVTKYIKANQVIDEAGAGVVGNVLSGGAGGAIAGFMTGNKWVGGLGALGGMVIKSPKTQRAFITLLKRIEGVESAAIASKMVRQFVQENDLPQVHALLMNMVTQVGLRESLQP